MSDGTASSETTIDGSSKIGYGRNWRLQGPNTKSGPRPPTYHVSLRVRSDVMDLLWILQQITETRG